jgi:hypothetical protein
MLGNGRDRLAISLLNEHLGNLEAEIPLLKSSQLLRQRTQE